MSLFVGWLMMMVLPSLASYGNRVWFVFLISVVAFVLVDLGPIIWFGLPYHFFLFNGAFHLGTGLIAGAVMGAILKPGAQGMKVS